jgi:hypothetical protein
MRTAWLWKSLPFLMISTAMLVACGSRGGQLPTQTPAVMVVTPVSPQAEETVTPEAFPTPFICRAEIVEQPFEHGYMIWIGKGQAERCNQNHTFALGTGEIWVAIFDEDGTGGEWLTFDDTWQSASEPAFDPTLTPPAGLLQPVRGFGKVWRESLTEAQRQALGWATYIEVKFVTDYRYDAGGFIDPAGQYVPRPGQHTVVGLMGERFFFDEATQRFQYIPAEQ